MGKDAWGATEAHTRKEAEGSTQKRLAEGWKEAEDGNLARWMESDRNTARVTADCSGSAMPAVKMAVASLAYFGSDFPKTLSNDDKHAWVSGLLSAVWPGHLSLSSLARGSILPCLGSLYQPMLQNKTAGIRPSPTLDPLE